MPDVSDRCYEFRHMTFGELRRLDADHPVMREFSRASLDRLMNCPDITDDFPAFFFIVDGDDRIVCSSKALPDCLWLGDRRLRWAWIGGTGTAVDHRGRGLARMLLRESTRTLHERNIGRGAVFASEIILHACRKLGYTLPGFAARYLMIRNPRPFLEAWLRSKPVSAMLGMALAPAMRLVFRAWSRERGIDGRQVTAVRLQPCKGSRLADVLQVCNPLTVHFNQSLQKLAWKVEVSNTNAGNDCGLYLLTSLTGGDPLAYFVVRTKEVKETMGSRYRDFRMMTLMDYGLFTDDRGIYSSVLKEALRLFRRSGAEVFEVITNCPTFGSVIRRMGLIKIGKGMSFVFALPEGWDFGKEYEDLRKWPLTHFCGDGFSF